MPCPFCKLPEDRLVASSLAGAAIRNFYSVTVGHTLVIPRRHVACVFDLPVVMQNDLWGLVRHVRDELRDQFGVTAFTIGINDGVVAGQTVPHAHIHVIPRRKGDLEDPLRFLELLSLDNSVRR